MSAAQKHQHDSHETRIALLEQSIDNIGQILVRLETKIDRLDTKIDDVEKRINARIDRIEERLGARIDRLDARIDKIDNRLWQITFLISSSVIGIVLARIFHWF